MSEALRSHTACATRRPCGQPPVMRGNPATARRAGLRPAVVVRIDKVRSCAALAGPNYCPSVLGERRFQYLFESAANLLALQNEISVDPQANHGTGTVDVCLSRRDEACCIELKVGNHAQLSHGLTKQLPAYMGSKRARSGRFVVLVRGGDPTPDSIVQRLQRAHAGMRDSESIRYTVIDSQTRKSASVSA